MRLLVVDDEPLARKKLISLLSREDDVKVVGEARNGLEAIELIHEMTPDLVFLDVEMPEMDGLEVVRKVDPMVLPMVIFVTAFDRYAIEAFEVHAVDYLLKPFDRARLSVALGKARERRNTQDSGAINQRLLDLIDKMKGEEESTGDDRIVIKGSGRLTLLKTEQVDWVDAAGNYVRIHADGDTHLLRETMAGIEKKLDPNKFVRIHRSTIVNIERIRELHHLVNRDYQVILDNGKKLPLSRTYRKNLKFLLSDEG